MAINISTPITLLAIILIFLQSLCLLREKYVIIITSLGIKINCTPIKREIKTGFTLY